MVFDQTVLQ